MFSWMSSDAPSSRTVRVRVRGVKGTDIRKAHSSGCNAPGEMCFSDVVSFYFEVGGRFQPTLTDVQYYSSKRNHP